MIKSDKILLRSGTAASWSATNPKLELGEIGYELDTRKIKVGDGEYRWNGLSYIYTGDANAAGSTGQVQFNNGGVLGTNANFFWDNASSFLGIGTASPGSRLDVKGTLRLSGSTSGYVGLAPASAAGSTTYTLPSTDGISGQFLSTNGSGTLSWATASSSVADGDKGDITVSSSGTVWTIDANTVTNAKLSQVVTSTIKGRSTAGTGDVEDLTPAQVRTIINVADGATANTGTVTSIATNNGITGGTITTTGTIGLTGQALALHNLASSGLIARTALGAVSARTITGTTNQVTVTDGDGVFGNPTLSLPQNIHTAATPTFAGITAGYYRMSSAIIVTDSSTSRTLSASDDGKVLLCTNNSAVTITVDTAVGTTGFSLTVMQIGSGQVTFSASGVTINNRQSHTKTAGQYAVVSLICRATNVLVLAGDTGA